MTREQMIAWLTLEGWVPVTDSRPLEDRGDWYGVAQGGHQIVGSRPNYPKVAKLSPPRWHVTDDIIDDFDIPADWSSIRDDELALVYKAACEEPPE